MKQPRPSLLLMFFATLVTCLSLGCGGTEKKNEEVEDTVSTDSDSRSNITKDIEGEQDTEVGQKPSADVVKVAVNGNTFSVTLASPDTGCEQYANWWEVVKEDGTLVYRRILAHSHVDEQPFTRSGGPVDVSTSETLIVRGHMSVGGYGKKVARGTISSGFDIDDAQTDFAPNLAQAEPQPRGCAF